ncbi:HTH domain-containing protein [Caulobacter sp. BK020]|uniref:helix-turn-helix transcriptional regulator n=1 Tax=Caulobacter sp. BK020 TaxID=2512117 RepID=UPI001FB3C29F|nr:HTH domain-containing protein [Caulobacter sp. BK020]
MFDLLQVLRRHRGTVSGGALAREMGVSLRTIRRDIATLQAIGAEIDGEPGVGYILRPGFMLPPLAFTEEELLALAAGAQWVSNQTDQAWRARCRTRWPRSTVSCR